MDDELLKEFLIESHENLERLDRELVQLEQTPADPKLLGSIFRTVHTIKGSCGFFGYEKLQSVTHVGENLLGRLRDGDLSVTPEIGTALLHLNDAIRQMLQQIEADGTEGGTDYSDLVRRLEELKEGKADSPPKPAPAPARPPAPKFVKSSERAPAPKPEPEPVAPSPPPSPPAADHEAGEAKPGVADQSIRVDIGLLDKLMNLVGELVLTRNQILQNVSSVKDTAFANTTQRLNLITTELQEGVMKTRMQQIKTIWNRFPRLIRDTAMYCRKQVRLEMEGGDTELDRSLLEAIRDPLTHILRNSVDHGVEVPEKRQAAGKPAEGVVKMRAYHEGGQVIIEIADDGGGINPQKIAAKALERSLITRDQAGRMSERELLQLIFLPGFSTAEAVTNVSGRGVGMDVVKTNIEKIGGTVDLQSQFGHGTTLRIKIPLTLAIVPALIVKAGGERFAIPQVSLLELVRLEGAAVRKGVEYIHDAAVYRLRGRLLPLVDLTTILGFPGPASIRDREVANIVVLQMDGRPFGLVVDAIADTQEIVVKPLGRLCKDISVFAGATIMGDGRVALILDVAGVAAKVELKSKGAATAEPERRAGGAGSCQLMLLKLGERRLAVPLDLVARLEEIAPAAIERACGREVIQYRGDLLRLIRLSEVLGEPAPELADQPIQVVVYAEGGKHVGVVVDEIVDIIEATPGPMVDGGQAGVSGSTVVANRVTDVLDVRAVIRGYLPDFAA